MFETSGFKSLCTFLMVSRHTVHFLRPGEASLRVIGASPAVTGDPGDRERQSPQQGSPWPLLGFSTAGDGAAPHTQPCCGQQTSQQDPACVRQKLQEQYRLGLGGNAPSVASAAQPKCLPPVGVVKPSKLQMKTVFRCRCSKSRAASQARAQGPVQGVSSHVLSVHSPGAPFLVQFFSACVLDRWPGYLTSLRR